MVQDNGKKTFEVSLGREQYKKVEEIAESKDLTVGQFARESLQNSIERHEVHEVVADACENEVLSEESRACKHIAKNGQFGQH